MSAGAAIDEALKLAGRATGLLCFMWVKRSGSRSGLEEAATFYERAAATIRSALPAPPPAEYPEASPGEDQQ